MSANLDGQILGFQAEAKQLLHLMIHSLYSNREVFLRELISNASDAADKLRFMALSDPQLLESKTEASITIEIDKDARTITVADNGIGMSRDEVIANLGTIARSGTAKFIQELTGDQQKDSQLIGKFGVGFYSAFIVASEVEVITRRAGLPAEESIKWHSNGESHYAIQSARREANGTSIVLHLRKDADEFLDEYRLRSIIRKYADHISIPVRMRTANQPETGDDQSQSDAYEVINVAKALWTRPRQEISEGEYQEFYKHISHDYEEPLAWSHNKVEGKLEYTSLLYIPARAPFDLWNRDGAKGLRLYAQRVFIMDDAEQFLPLYLRFVKGIVDSSDISLNVSREILQQDPKVDAIKSALTKRALEMLDTLKENQEQYAKFWNEFGNVLKEGIGEDYTNRQKIIGLLRFSTTESSGDSQDQTIDQYIARMKEGQSQIYYIISDSLKAARNSPHLEVFRKKGIEVIFLHDRIDGWMMGYINEYLGKTFQDITRGTLDLGVLEDESDKKRKEMAETDFKDLLTRAKSSLGDRVKELRFTYRLTDSPACIALGDHELSDQVRKIMEAAGQSVPESKPILELNPGHPLVKKLDQESNSERFDDLLEVIFGQAALAHGREIDEPSRFTQRLNRLLMELNFSS